VAPVYLQQAPTATYVQQAPAATYVQQAPAATYVQQAPVAAYVQQAPVASYVQQAPAATYVQQAPQVVYAQQAPVYSAPASPVYSAPMGSGSAAAVGSAPLAGSRIKVVDRNDIIEELRKDAKDNVSSGTTRERRKALRDSAATKYAEAVGADEAGLNDYENQDIDLIVNSIIDGTNSNSLTKAAGYPQYVASAPAYAPAYTTAQPTMMVQPVVPVQLYVPVRYKHHLFNK
jgi:hypothetical protein